MDRIARLTPFLSVTDQLAPEDVVRAAAMGFRAIVNNRPDGEAQEQPAGASIEVEARRHGLDYRHIPVVSGQVSEANVAEFAAAMDAMKGPVLAFCRTGTRSTTLWALSQAPRLSPEAILHAAQEAGYNLEALRDRLERAWLGKGHAAAHRPSFAGAPSATYDIVVVGGGAAGIATAASLKRRRPGLSIVVIEPNEHHFYQPGWTLVGGGVFDSTKTDRAMADVMPRGVSRIRAAVAGFEPEDNRIVLEDGVRIGYRILVAAPGIKLDWEAVEGLQETLGRNGVTSNYRFGMAPYTWDMVQALDGGEALFTQPPMPIKCAGAPQKAMYLSCDHWQRKGTLGRTHVQFNNAGPVLFGVKEFVPPLMAYVEKYGIDLAFNSNLRAVDGPARKAWFDVKDAEGKVSRIEKRFDMIHVCPPQCAPDVVRKSPLADAAGWIEVDKDTLQHVRFANVFGLGDAASAPNAKTAAAVRKQAPTVADNALAVLDGKAPWRVYDGYGSCPLTVERGKIVLAEFGYGGKLLPTFPFLEPTKPSRLAWLLKEKLLPWIYWDLMLKGNEMLVKPERLT
jgi:sulfide:quinone oxidoreductase